MTDGVTFIKYYYYQLFMGPYANFMDHLTIILQPHGLRNHLPQTQTTVPVLLVYTQTGYARREGALVVTGKVGGL